jgi:hypothetical protein
VWVTPRRAGPGISFALLLACGDDPPAPEPTAPPAVAVAPEIESPPPEDKIYAVNLASTPIGAHVLLSGAELGTTPYKLEFKRKTTVRIEADAYLPAEVTVDETSEPNVVVGLQPDPAWAAGGVGNEGAGTAGPPEATVIDATAKGTATKNDASKSSSSKSANASKPADAGTPPTEPSSSTPKPKSGLPYPDVAAAKSDYQQGRIDRDEYDQAVRKLKLRRAKKIEVIRAQYQAGEYDKDEYNRRKRIIDNEYRGT